MRHDLECTSNKYDEDCKENEVIKIIHNHHDEKLNDKVQIEGSHYDKFLKIPRHVRHNDVIM